MDRVSGVIFGSLRQLPQHSTADGAEMQRNTQPTSHQLLAFIILVCFFFSLGWRSPVVQFSAFVLVKFRWYFAFDSLGGCAGCDGPLRGWLSSFPVFCSFWPGSPPFFFAFFALWVQFIIVKTKLVVFMVTQRSWCPCICFGLQLSLCMFREAVTQWFDETIFFLLSRFQSVNKTMNHFQKYCCFVTLLFSTDNLQHNGK